MSPLIYLLYELTVKKEIEELPNDSKDIYKRSDLDRYLDRPNQSYQSGKYAVLDSLCNKLYKCS